MMSQPQAPEEIVSFCSRCSEAFSRTAEADEQIAFAREELAKLQRERNLFAGMLSGIIEGEKYPDLRQATMFDNELLLHFDPVHKFSLRAFLWEPGEYTPVHDHGSWGVIGPVTGKLEVINYRREDNGSNDERVVLREEDRLTLEPGDTEFTLPLNDGIHEVGNPTAGTIFTLSLYGKPLPRGYIKGFNVAEGRAYRILAPQTKKKLLVVRALSGLDAEAGERTLKNMAEHPVEVFRELGAAGFGNLT